MKRLIWLPIAGFLIIAGAAAASAAPGLANSAAALLTGAKPQANAAASPDPAASPSAGTTDPTEPSTGSAGPDSLLTQTLADLVSKGTITQAQSDAIVQALTAKVDARRAEIEAQRQKFEQMWTQIQGFLSDGVITSDELAQLPADNPFSKLTDILADGKITLQELQSIGPLGGLFEGPGGPGRGHHGPGGWFEVPGSGDSDGTTDPGTGASPNATPSTTGSSS